MKKFVFTFLLLSFCFSIKCFSQTVTADSTVTLERVYVDVGFLLNDLQKPIQLKILTTDPENIFWKTNPDLMKAIKKKLSEYSQEILSSEWSDTTDSYRMHLIYNVKNKEIE